MTGQILIDKVWLRKWNKLMMMMMMMTMEMNLIVMTIIVMMTPQFLKYKVWFGYLIRGAFRKWKMVKVGIDQNAQTWDKNSQQGAGGSNRLVQIPNFSIFLFLKGLLRLG